MPAYNDNYTITVLVNANPKNPRNGATNAPAKAAQRFNLYKTGMTVGQYKALVAQHPAGGKNYAAADIIWDTNHGYIRITPPGGAAVAAPQTGTSTAKAPAPTAKPATPVAATPSPAKGKAAAKAARAAKRGKAA